MSTNLDIIQDIESEVKEVKNLKKKPISTSKNKTSNKNKQPIKRKKNQNVWLK